MEKGNWGDPKRLWGLEKTYDAGRMIDIYEAIKGLPIYDIVDIACGVGIVADGLQWKNLEWNIEQFDIKSYPEWEFLEVKPYVEDVMEFIKIDRKYDLVMMLNSYRNWDGEDKELFDAWVKRNAKYFITSGGRGVPIGKDVHGFMLMLETL